MGFASRDLLAPAFNLRWRAMGRARLRASYDFLPQPAGRYGADRNFRTAGSAFSMAGHRLWRV